MGKESTKTTLEKCTNCVTSCKETGHALIETLLGLLGRHSVVLDSTFGHQDSTNGKQIHKVKEYYQSKNKLLSSGRSNLLLESFNIDGSVPPAVVALPRYNIYIQIAWVYETLKFTQ
jgi:hypothetical protein